MKGLNTSLWLTIAEVAGYRQLLESEGITPSDEAVKKLATLGAKNAHLLPREMVVAQFADPGKYPEQVSELARISQEIAKIRKEFYPDEPKYQEPPRIKLLRAIGDFQAVLAMRANEEGLAREVVLYELSNILYYNAQDWLQDHDIRSHDAVVDLFSGEAKEPPETALNAAIAKYQCRLEQKDEHYRDPEKMRTLELERIRESLNE
jgi:hypothetical protein